MARTLLHPALAVALPLLFLATMTEVARPLVGLRLSLFAYLALLLAGLEEVVVGNILYEERVGAFERAREPFYLLAALAVALFVLEPQAVLANPARLLGPEPVYLGVLVILEWAICWRFHHGLRERELLDAALQDKQGRQLLLALRNNAELAVSALASLARLKGTIVLLQVLPFAAVLALFAIGQQVSAAGGALLLCNGAAAVLSMAVLNQAVEDQVLAGEGASLTPFYRRRRSLYGLALLAFAAAIAAVYARDASLLSLSVFAPLLEWLSSLLLRRELPWVAMRPRTGLGAPELELLRRLQADAAQPSPLLDLLRFLVRVVWNVMKVALALAMAFFLAVPFGSRNLYRRLRSLRPLAFLREKSALLLAALGRMLADLLAWLGRRSGRPVHARRIQRSWHARLVLPKRGLFRRWEMNAVLRAYQRLIRWGVRCGVRFRAALAPGEYLHAVAARVPEHATAIEEAAGILEESLFSAAGAGWQRLQRYLSILRQVVRTRPPVAEPQTGAREP